MRTLKFYGASDDLFEIDGTKAGEPDEIGCYDRAAAVEIRQQDKGLVVCGVYAPGKSACWAIGISPIDEDQPLPDWPMSWSFTGYTAELTIQVPDHVVITKLAPE